MSVARILPCNCLLLEAATKLGEVRTGDDFEVECWEIADRIKKCIEEEVTDNSKIEKMILELISEIDYDIYKSYLPECSEYPKEIPERMAALVAIVEKYLRLCPVLVAA